MFCSFDSERWFCMNPNRLKKTIVMLILGVVLGEGNFWTEVQRGQEISNIKSIVI